MGLFNVFKKSRQRKDRSNKISTAHGDYQGITMDKSLDRNIDTLKTIFKDCDDIIFRPFKIACQINASLVFMDGMAKTESIDNFIMKPLLTEYRLAGIKIKNEEDALQYAKESIISTSNMKETRELEAVLFHIMSGDSIILIDRNESVIAIDTKGWEHRQVEQPTTETTVHGSKDAFTENILTNIALVRRHLRDPKLKLKNYHIGRRSKTQISVMYIEDIIDPKLLEEVYKRLDGIDVDSVSGGNFIEQLIEDNWISPFPQFNSSERPDKTAAALLDGKVCLLTDNSPYVSILPATMNDLLTSPDDYYDRWLTATLIRVVRLTGATASTILPALYVAMLSYHPEMIPTPLALSIAKGREGVPFPAFLEAFIMEGAFELMREAGIRLPGNLGQTVGVVGAVVIGQAAVAAGVVSPAMVIVVALTGIANFAIPSIDVALSYRILRFGLIILASVLGIYGVILGLLLILSHLSVLKSFGTPYMAPWVPLNLRDLKDTIIRAPSLSMRYRPSFMGTQDKRRADLDKKEENMHRRKSGK